MSYYNRGLAYHHLNIYDNSIRDYNVVINRNEKYKSVLNNRGLVYYKINELELCIIKYIISKSRF